MSLDDADINQVLAFLRSETGLSVSTGRCLYAKKVEECPPNVQQALHAAKEDRSVSARAIRRVLAMYVQDVPAETSIRRHRGDDCACLKETQHD